MRLLDVVAQAAHGAGRPDDAILHIVIPEALRDVEIKQFPSNVQPAGMQGVLRMASDGEEMRTIGPEQILDFERAHERHVAVDMDDRILGR